MKSGQPFRIRLEGPGGEGTGRHLRPPDARRAELLSEKTRAGSEGRAGGPVLSTRAFRAREAGPAEIRRDGRPSREGGEKAAERFRGRILAE